MGRNYFTRLSCPLQPPPPPSSPTSRLPGPSPGKETERVASQSAVTSRAPCAVKAPPQARSESATLRLVVGSLRGKSVPGRPSLTVGRPTLVSRSLLGTKSCMGRIVSSHPLNCRSGPARRGRGPARRPGGAPGESRLPGPPTQLSSHVGGTEPTEIEIPPSPPLAGRFCVQTSLGNIRPVPPRCVFTEVVTTTSRPLLKPAGRTEASDLEKLGCF